MEGMLSMRAAEEYWNRKKKNDKKAEALEELADDIEKNINNIKKIIGKLRFDAQRIRAGRD